jgi:hypothetical protein
MKATVILQGRMVSTVPVARNGMCIPTEAVTVIQRAVQKAVKAVIDFGKTDRFTQPNYDIQFAFHTFVSKEVPEGKFLFVKLARTVLECFVPEGLLHLITKKGIETYPYTKKVLSGLKG